MSGGWPDDFDPADIGIPPTPWSFLPRGYAWQYADPTAQNPETCEASWVLAGGYLTGISFHVSARPAGPLGFFGRP